MEARPRTIVVDQPVVAAAPNEALFDSEGDVQESDDVLAGLTLPRGLELVHQQGRRHIYYSDVALERMQAYFGPRLVTAVVERQGSGAIFRRAIPRGVTGGVIRLDVAVLERTPSGTRLVIDELPGAVRDEPPPLQPERIREVERALRYLD